MGDNTNVHLTFFCRNVCYCHIPVWSEDSRQGYVGHIQRLQPGCLVWTIRVIYYYFFNFEAEELSIVYANRSAALNHLQQHEETLADIKRCIALGFPSQLKYKVFERRARSLLVLKRNQEAIKAFQ